MRKNGKVIFFTLFGLTLISVMIFLVYLFFRNDTIVLNLEHFKNANGEYQYADIDWGNSLDDVISELDFVVIEMSENNIVVNGKTFQQYSSEKLFELDGQNSAISFEFYDEEIEGIEFDFLLNEDYQKWYENIIQKLIQINGEPDDVFENSNEIIQSTSYKWETENTMMQFMIMIGNDNKVSATIGVGKK